MGTKDTNQSAGLMLCQAIGDAMKANTTQRELLAQLTRQSPTKGLESTQNRPQQINS